jgi:hypothetical protein
LKQVGAARLTVWGFEVYNARLLGRTGLPALTAMRSTRSGWHWSWPTCAALDGSDDRAAFAQGNAAT